MAKRAGQIALAVVALGFGLVVGTGTAVADGHTVVNPDGTFGSQDVNNSYGTDWVPAVQSYKTSSYPADSGSGGRNAPQVLYPVGHSYPASPSWPDNSWGATDD
ncbi:hypothetical protein [Mycolicibacterium sphagni]|uniref:Uncharacterized protein n=1 Tax=Mycolicibacterium sphagni TaxID=1786 RepID=A0ABX2K0G4_9MYCO|nr:hypothetical protein [Mycolicibacterium sphagni]NTY63486.1 hypothetical protein [Mycolicibacterium sphagni]